MTRPVRVGVIGCGAVAQTYIPLVLRLNASEPTAEIVVACDVDERRRDQVRERYGVTEFTVDEREVVASPDVDLVLVLTPMQEHGRIARAGLEAGKHVLVEKPMAMGLEEAAAIVDLARRGPGYLICAPHVVLSPTYRAIWRRIERGDIGPVLSARGFYGWSGPTWSAAFYQAGGGALFDLGVYNVTTLTGLLGPAKRVMAMSGIAIPERVIDGQRVQVQSDDNVQLLLDFGDAAYAVVTTGFTIQRYRCAGIELYGSEGTIQTIGEDWAPKGYELWQNRAGQWQTFEDGSGWPWADGVRHAIACVRQGTPPLVKPEHAYHVLEIMLKAMESGRTGQAITIESTFEPPRFERGSDLEETAHLVGEASGGR